MIATATAAPMQSLRSYAAPPPAASPHTPLETAALTAGTGLVAASVASTTAAALEYATVPLAGAVLSAYPTVQGLMGVLYFSIFAQLGATAALAGTAAVGLAAGALASRQAPQDAGAVRRLFEGPASAVRDGLSAVGAAASRKEAAKAGATAGWKAGKAFGTVAGGLEGVGTGYALGMLGAGLLTASLPLSIGAAVAGAAVGAAGLGMVGRYLGGALGSGFGAIFGAAGYDPQNAQRPPAQPTP